MSETTAAARQLVAERVTAAFTGSIYADAAHAISAYSDGTLNDAWRDGFVRHVMDVIVEAAMAAAPLIEAAARADERAKVAEEVATAVTAQRRTGITAMLEGGWNHAVETMAGIARQHAHAGPADPSHGQNEHMPGEQRTGRANGGPESHQDATEPQPAYEQTPKPAQGN